MGAAAREQRIPELVAELARQQAAAQEGRGEAAGALPPVLAAGAGRPGRPGLLGHAAALAARQLADPRGGGSARHAQAFVELLVERRLLGHLQARKALHNVLEAYGREGDLPGVSEFVV